MQALTRSQSVGLTLAPSGVGAAAGVLASRLMAEPDLPLTLPALIKMLLVGVVAAWLVAAIIMWLVFWRTKALGEPDADASGEA